MLAGVMKFPILGDEMKVSVLTLLILNINSLIDSGKYADISISDVHSRIEGNGVLRFLK